MRLLLVLAGSATLLVGCRSASPVAQAPQNPQTQMLARAWRHSQEEDQGSVQVYRPASYSFPPARGREGITFEPTGRLTKFVIAPTDGLLPLPGQWTWDNAHVVHLRVAGPPAQSYRLKIVELTPDMLKVSRIDPR
ncbi:hypothetical protein QMK33_21245 [Hymenobacter sp. H14-R3]|uniref:hypothetical protein n=1 Tax=Hymenobacter sp. H14-R3 TaxID=3046308 RepID=UPI0024B8ADF0|nr:hypothetical protein [Hymenobacter sp. H14-R3]MDJ0367679.1 hypothetical protein [Hymenobacter sp. H14-R3]